MLTRFAPKQVSGVTLKKGFHRLGSQQYIQTPSPAESGWNTEQEDASPTGHALSHGALSTEVHLIEGDLQGPDCKVTCFTGLLAGLMKKCRPKGRAVDEEEPQLSAEERKTMDLLTQVDV